ncbi:MAG: FAD:protein FMN transferase, partial [Deltaproteobacteria bacterium]|nr:FAD:protein FMN transferase [Deltaproteobacteria bacterium]
MLKKEELFKRIKKRISLLENILSSHLPDSELEKLNNSPVSRKMTVPTELYDAVNAGIAWNIKTSGAFDITAGPLITLWKNAGKTGHVPTDREIESAMKNTGIDKIVLERSDFSIMKTVNVSIDLGGLGKGFTADDIAGLLKENGQESALIAMSGDIRAVGRRPDGRLWRVGVQDPRYPENLNALVTIVEIGDMAVSTSGNYRRFVEINGKRYSHIIDPRTGRTADNVPSVSVIGPD